MGVIAILISLLVPALTLVRDYSKEIQQRAQFHGIDVGLEMYKTEFGNYPPSKDNADPPTGTNAHPDDPTPYSGANKLAEAMVGLDMLGFHPKSDFRSDGVNIRDDGTASGAIEDFPVYHPLFDDFNANGALIETGGENVQARKGPFLDLENANAYELQDVYTDTRGYRTATGSVGIIDQSLVLCDEYINKRQSGKKTGMPILYYRARRAYTQQDTFDGIDNDIYYYPDNQNILDLGVPEDQAGPPHPLYAGGGAIVDYDNFEYMIINTQVTKVKRPYRADSYILVSAGKDGLYGTPDDMFNFQKKN